MKANNYYFPELTALIEKRCVDHYESGVAEELEKCAKMVRAKDVKRKIKAIFKHPDVRDWSVWDISWLLGVDFGTMDTLLRKMAGKDNVVRGKENVFVER
jgi:hypothetical protein